MKSVMRNLRSLFGKKVNTYQTYQARCLTPNQMAAVKWWDAQWYQDWQRAAGIQHP
jgi:hypothetical protein